MDAGAGVGQVAGPGQTPGTDMTSISFRDQLWLNSFPLDCALVFDYFALSPFYDRTCSNEQLRMRSIHPLDAANLKNMIGIEYILHEAQEPHLFVINVTALKSHPALCILRPGWLHLPSTSIVQCCVLQGCKYSEVFD